MAQENAEIVEISDETAARVIDENSRLLQEAEITQVTLTARALTWREARTRPAVVKASERIESRECAADLRSRCPKDPKKKAKLFMSLLEK